MNQYRCNQCGLLWKEPCGKCPECGGMLRKDVGSVATRSKPILLSEIETMTVERTGTGLPLLDKALSGGYVGGYSILLSGGPGLGKSTLLLEAVCRFGHKSIYCTSEEDQWGIKSRAARLDLPMQHATIYPESEGEKILEEIPKGYMLAVLDSVQTTSYKGSPIGALQGAKELVLRMHRWAHDHHTVAIMVCHETKDGESAGPRALEHYVDCLLELDLSPSGGENRILSTRKNRQGIAPISTPAKMTAGGLIYDTFYRDDRRDPRGARALMGFEP